MLPLASAAVHATIVTETWTSTVTSVNHTSAFAPGDTFLWTVTYDNASLRMHEYYDGANSVAERGGGDDTTRSTLCAGNQSSSPGCTHNYSSTYTLFADAQFDLNELFTPLVAEGRGGYDALTENHSWRYTTNTQEPFVNYYADDRTFDLAIGRIYTPPAAAGGGWAWTGVHFTSTLQDTHPVPTPSVLALLGLGLLGMSRKLMRKA